jgi:hypothetical protein
LTRDEILQDNTIIFGPNNEKRVAAEKPQVNLIELLIKYNNKVNSFLFLHLDSIGTVGFFIKASSRFPEV